MFYSSCLRIPDGIFLSFATFFEFLTEFFQWFYSNSLLLNAPSLLAASSFYSVILGFWGTTDSPHLLPWVQEPMLCWKHWWLVPFLFLIIFFFWHFFPKSLLLTFRSGVSPESWPLILLPSRLQNLTFSDSAFLATFPFVIFPKWVDSSLLGWKFSQLLSLMFLLSGFLEVPAPCSWIVSFQVFYFLFASLGWLIRTYLLFVPCVS